MNNKLFHLNNNPQLLDPSSEIKASPYIGRFAPTPSGFLHFGSLVAALGSYLDAKAHNGIWLLRIEDIDHTRSRPEYLTQILHTLEAYQLYWDGDIRHQSQHLSDYQSALEALSPHLYPCHCSRQDWHQSALMGALGWVYPRTCQNNPLPNLQTQSALRLRLPEVYADFTDRLHGICRYHLQREIGDPIIRRKDGAFAYALAVTIDDALQGVTDVVRGADLLAATVIQNQIQSALNLPRPRYLHLPLVRNERGEKLSKSQAAPAINPQDILTTTRRALAFLNQPTHEACDQQSALLELAIKHWNPHRILPNKAL
ncbi:MAG: tRNA glutamyl-Q(34) synthetase GluQRS [Cardiobacteriaceae bacterium]|nr:tRNA glutamyl-Q(34) synthetase GluQRS [Cardiobacteriaceae bacterium]